MEEKSKSEETKEKIIDAAAQVFARDGLDRARMDDIGKEAGVSKGGLYWHFKSKEEIVIQIVSKFMEMDMGKMRKKVREEGLTASEKCYQILEITNTDLMKMKALIPLMFEFIGRINKQPIFQKMMKKYYDIGREIFHELIQGGVDSGEFREINVVDATNAFTAMFEGMIMVCAVDGELDTWLYRATSATEMFLNGIVKKE